MDEPTRYKLQKRIKELEEYNRRLVKIKFAAEEIFTTVCTQITEGKGINTGWIIRQFRAALFDF